MTDMINHPPHYKQGKYETIDIILDITKNLPGDQGYLVGNIIKYMSRYYFKNGKQDVEKARWYINKLIDVIDEKQQTELNEYSQDVMTEAIKKAFGDVSE